ncbi:MAG: YhcH/YjgK/YiaL family protein [Spirochaetales bacterium]|nr:YhcH/YjgK/YiaL family protein [Spirochaetales bacterium]
MVLASLYDLKKYRSLIKNFDYLQGVLSKTDFEAIEKGKHELDFGMFFIVSEYQTKSASESLLEFHKKYIDLQFIVEGKENIGYEPILSDHLDEYEYNSDDDIAFTQQPGSFVTLNEDDFALFFPHDGHAPCLHSDSNPRFVRKVVFKLPV